MVRNLQIKWYFWPLQLKWWPKGSFWAIVTFVDVVTFVGSYSANKHYNINKCYYCLKWPQIHLYNHIRWYFGPFEQNIGSKFEKVQKWSAFEHCQIWLRIVYNDHKRWYFGWIQLKSGPKLGSQVGVLNIIHNGPL